MKPYRFVSAGAVLALLLSACDASVDVGTSTTLTAQEAQMAADVVGQSMADQSEGMMSDMYDMDAGLDVSALVYHEGPLARGNGRFDLRLWRPSNRQDGRVRYDSTTGTHRVTYSRSQGSGNNYRAIQADLAYVFTDASGRFMRNPRRDRDRVAAISFEGTRSGEARLRRPRDGQTVESSFRRESSWALSGLLGATAAFRGDQTSSGTMRVNGADSTERSFTVRMRTDNVTVTRARASQGLETTLTGTLHYDVVLKRPGQDEKRATGTIDLTQDGKALMRFMGLKKVYKIDLASGGAERDGDDEDDD
jgi:hypothetical protein